MRVSKAVITGEALSRLLLGTGNQGGFRASGRGDENKFVVLYTSGEDRDAIAGVVTIVTAMHLRSEGAAERPF
jgi:hypothetical protein